MQRTSRFDPLVCSPWCDPAFCNAGLAGGVHSSTVTRVGTTATEPCAFAVSLNRPGDAVGPTLVVLEVQHDPNTSAALGMSTESDVFLYSLSQAEHLRWALTRLLEAV